MDVLHFAADGSSRRSSRYILALCAGWFGLQQIFSVFYASGYFYLASLGFSDTSISLTWLSGPVAGMLFQPLIGVMSDKCTHSWGKRRPFIVAGAIFLVGAMLTLAWSDVIITTLVDVPARELRTDGQRRDSSHWSLYVLAAACILVANFAVQPIQLGLRALIVDLVPVHQQAQAHAWVSKTNLLGSIVGYSIGAIDLTDHLRFLGQTQLQILCAIVSFSLITCISITCYCVQEQVPAKLVDVQTRLFRKPKLSYFTCLEGLPITKSVCVAQLFCWLAWFPFLFYFSKYIVNARMTDSTGNNTEIASSEKDALSLTSSFAMLIFSVTSLISVLILARLAHNPQFSSQEKIHRHFLTLRHIWMIGQVIFCGGTMSTFVVNTVQSAHILAALLGISWAAGTWIPFTMISKEIGSQMPVLGVHGTGVNVDVAATVVGVHNAAISAPQIVAALGSTLLFLLSQDGQANVNNHGIGSEVWLLRAGGLSALGAAWVIYNMPDDVKEHAQVVI